MGGMESGSIWGHGSYVAPDWSADYLHREAVFILDEWSQKEFSNDYASLASEQKAVLRQRLQDTIRKNNYDEATGGSLSNRFAPAPLKIISNTTLTFSPTAGLHTPFSATRKQIPRNFAS